MRVFAFDENFVADVVVLLTRPVATAGRPWDGSSRVQTAGIGRRAVRLLCGESLEFRLLASGDTASCLIAMRGSRAGDGGCHVGWTSTSAVARCCESIDNLRELSAGVMLPSNGSGLSSLLITGMVVHDLLRCVDEIDLESSHEDLYEFQSLCAGEPSQVATGSESEHEC